ncbi:MAG TPA: SBBP repeat-containing protein [Oligoflexia bacterium]|nr:SBBP repeat-containing protein [Oligoflexia bacterium]
MLKFSLALGIFVLTLVFSGCGGGVSIGAGNNAQNAINDFLASLPKVVWGAQIGSVTTPSGGDSSNLDGCMAVTGDDAGNIYCAGETHGSLGEATAGGPDAYLAKFNATGQLEWLTQLGAVTKKTGRSNAGAETVKGITLDTAGNIYITGATNGSMGEGNGGGYDIFVAKFTSTGALSNIFQLGDATRLFFGLSNAGDDTGYGIKVDASQNIFIGGSTTGSMGETNAGQTDVVLVKLNSAGVLQWIKQLGTTTVVAPGGYSNSSYDVCTGLAMNAAGDLYCGGYTASAMADNPGGLYDMLIVKWSSAGVVQMIKQLGRTNTFGANDNLGQDICRSIAVDADGYVYCGGSTTGNFGEARANSDGSWDIAVVKLSSVGNIEWATQLGANTKLLFGNNAGSDNCYALTLDSGGNVYCAGATSGALGETNAGSLDLVVVRLNSAGVLKSGIQLGANTRLSGQDNSSMEFCSSVYATGLDSVYCAGQTSGSQFEPNGGNNDAILTKLSLGK